MAVAVTGTSSGGRAGVASTSLTFSHTSDGNPLYIDIAQRSAQTIVSVTYNGVVCGIAASATVNARGLFTYFLAAPAAGTANVVITMGGGTEVAAIARNVSGGNTAGSVIANWTTAFATSTTPSVTVSSATNDLVLDIVATQANNTTFTVGGGQTKDFAHDSIADGLLKAGGSREAGAASVTMSWTVTSGAWVIAAYSIPASGTGGTFAERVSRVDVEAVTPQDATTSLRVSRVDVEAATPQAATTSLRVSQVSVEVVTDNIHIDVRLTAQRAEAMTQNASADVRLTGQKVEAMTQNSTADVRLTSQRVEILQSTVYMEVTVIPGCWMGDGAGAVWIE